MKSKLQKSLSYLLIMAVILSINVFGGTAAYAASGTKTVSSTGSMSVVLQPNQSGYSSIVSYSVTGLPTDAKVDKIEISVGTLTYQGAIATTRLEISSSNKSGTDVIAWGGAGSTTLTSSRTFFFDTDANGTYQIKFYATNASSINMASKTYSHPSIKVYYS